MRMTPPIYARGRYVLREPWVIPVPVQNYICIAIRSFRDLAAEDVDPYETFYEPMGVSVEQYESDAKNSACIVTLRSDDGQIYIHVPDTYIESYPETDAVPYSDLVLQVRLPKLPDYYDAEALLDDVLQYVDAHVGGTDNEGSVDKFPLTERISLADSLSLETARQASITDQDTWYVKFLQEQERNTNLLAEIQVLYQILEDNGWTQET